MRKLSFAAIFTSVALVATAYAEDKNPWADVKAGTVIVTESTTNMEKPAKMETKSAQTWTVKSNDGKEVVCDVVTETAGMKMPASEVKIPLKSDAKGGEKKDGPKVEELGNEKIKTPAGEFDCKHTKVTTEANGTKTTTEMWMAKDCPVAIKMVSHMTGSMESTTTQIVTKFEKK